MKMISVLGIGVILPVLTFNFLNVMFKTWRWNLLISRNGGSYPYFSALHSYFSGIALGVITPGRTGEFFRAYHPVQYGAVKMPVSIGTVIADRLYDLTFLLLISGIAALFVVKTMLLLLIIVGILGFLFLFWFGRSHFNKIMLFIMKKWGIKENHYNEFLISLRKSILNPWAPLILTLLGYLILNLQVYWVAISMGIDINFIELLLYFTLANTIALLPVSLSGLGTREAALGFIFVLSGHSGTEGVTLSLAFFILVAFPITIVGAVGLMLPEKLFQKH